MGLIDSLRGVLHASPTWVRLRHVRHEGFARAFRRRRLWGRILSTPPIETDAPGDEPAVEVRLLCYRRDYLTAIWSLKTFYHCARVRYPLAIHVQGDAPPRVFRRLREHFPNAQVIPQTEADAAVEPWLAERGFERLAAARRNNAFMLKLTDFVIMSRAVHLLTLDSDILFFRRPTELLGADASPRREHLVQRDPASTYNISEDRARIELGIDLAPQVNSGIMLFHRQSLNLARCEQLLAHPEVGRLSGWIEQTLYALCASESGAVSYLPDSYRISMEPGADVDLPVARHYAGPSRPFLTLEGMPRLIELGFLRDLRARSL